MCSAQPYSGTDYNWCKIWEYVLKVDKIHYEQFESLTRGLQVLANVQVNAHLCMVQIRPLNNSKFNS